MNSEGCGNMFTNIWPFMEHPDTLFGGSGDFMGEGHGVEVVGGSFSSQRRYGLSEDNWQVESQQRFGRLRGT